LEFCFDISAEHGPSKFIIFSLLIPFVHRNGLAGMIITNFSLFINEKKNSIFEINIFRFDQKIYPI
jgi:hypothetical protein